MNRSLKSIVKSWWWNARVTAFAVGTAIFIKIATKLMYEMQDVFESDVQNLGLKCQYNNPAKGTKYDQVVKELTKRTGISVNLWDENAEVTFVSPVFIRFAEMARDTFKSLFGLDYVRVTVDDPTKAVNNFDIVIQKRNADAPEVKMAKLRKDLLSILDTSYGSEERLKGEVLHAVLETFVAEGQELPIRPKEEFGGKVIRSWRNSIRELARRGVIDYDTKGIGKKKVREVLADLDGLDIPEEVEYHLGWVGAMVGIQEYLREYRRRADVDLKYRRAATIEMRKNDRDIYNDVRELSEFVDEVLT